MTADDMSAAGPPSVPPPGKHMHHDPVFPSAFVFQSNSALFLAIDWTPELDPTCPGAGLPPMKR
jgi:hypothetical protein